MKQTAGFSKYAVAFSDNHGDSVSGIEGPEELVQFLVKNKQQKSQPQKAGMAAAAANRAKPSPKTEGKQSERGKQLNQRKNDRQLSPEQPKFTVDSPHHEMAYEHQKSSRPYNFRGKTRGDVRGGHQIRKAEIFDAKHRVFDRHSGMTQTYVKPSPRTHGRDDYDIKNTLDNEINIDSTGHVNVNDNEVIDEANVNNTNNTRAPEVRSRPGRGGQRQPRGNNPGGRERYNNNPRRGRDSGEPRSFRPRGERGQQPTSSKGHIDATTTENKTDQPAFLFNDNDFPSFDA